MRSAWDEMHGSSRWNVFLAISADSVECEDVIDSLRPFMRIHTVLCYYVRVFGRTINSMSRGFLCLA